VVLILLDDVSLCSCIKGHMESFSAPDSPVSFWSAVRGDGNCSFT
jgi:hypothetical protein